MVEARRRHLGHAPLTSGEPAAVARNYVAVAIDQDRDIEAESVEAVRDLPDLFLAVARRIGRIQLDASINR